jgi:hypothetical protein
MRWDSGDLAGRLNTVWRCDQGRETVTPSLGAHDAASTLAVGLPLLTAPPLSGRLV